MLQVSPSLIWRIATSQPLMTSPTPTLNSKAPPRFLLDSNSVPSSNYPVVSNDFYYVRHPPFQYNELGHIVQCWRKFLDLYTT